MSKESRWDHDWHVALNRQADAALADKKPFPFWLYEAKQSMHELRYLPTLFRQEREGRLPQTMQACSRQPATVLPEPNQLICCLGVKTRQCPHLLALEPLAVEHGLEAVDTAKAHTCVAHILSSDQEKTDTSEGYITDASTRAYWQSVYASLAETSSDEGDVT